MAFKTTKSRKRRKRIRRKRGNVHTQQSPSLDVDRDKFIANYDQNKSSVAVDSINIEVNNDSVSQLQYCCI